MAPKMIYMCDNEFYGSFDRLVADIQTKYGLTITYDEYNRLRHLNNEHNFYEAMIESDIHICEYKNINTGFMKCVGPSAECCFTIPKSKKEFIEEATQYFAYWIRFCDDINVVTTETENTILIQDSDASDLMIFKYIKPTLLY